MPSAALFSWRGEGALVLKVEQSSSDGPPSGEGLTAGHRDGSTIHRDQGVVAPRALLMDRAGDELFAGAGFPLEEDGGSGGRHDLYLPQHFFEGRAFADDLFNMVRSSETILDNVVCPG